MKLIVLNTWGGRIHDGLMAFVKKHSDVDVFCFQEVYDEAHGKDQYFNGTNFNLYADLNRELDGYWPLFHPHLGDWWGLASFIKKDIQIVEAGEIYVHKEKGHNMELELLGHTAKNLQFIKTELNGTPLTIVNFHGLWNGQGKEDTEERINQSKNIIAFLKTLEGEVVLGGDFNLSPDTESLTMIARELGYRNLISEFGITSTRTSLYEKPNRYADYLFVSPGIQIKTFEVLPDEVSDHSPLYLDFDI